MIPLLANSGKTVTVIGGGVAGMSAACALAEAGLCVQLVERRGYLGGRASSYLHPGVGEVIDNCQHVIFACCTNILGFYQRIGVADRIHWTSEMTMIEPGGRRSRLGPFSLGPIGLPAPLHAAPSFLAASAFTLKDKLALGRAMRAMLRPEAMVDRGESLGDWLRRHKQTEGALNRFWRLTIASALNADIDSLSVPYAAKIIREGFLNSAEGGRMGMSKVPLSDLYSGVPAFLEERQSGVHLNAGVEAADWDEETSQWTVSTSKGLLTSDLLVLALPFEAMAKLLPHMPPGEGDVDALAGQLARHEHWPLCSVHLWFDREITELDHAVLLDREIHWMFNKSKFQPSRDRRGSYVELVVSASRSFATLDRNEAIALGVSELAEYFPEVSTAKLEKAALVKEMRATFGVPPGIEASRPASVSPWPNCFFAGDWIATGWPSTMESAARSGHLAAEAVCAALSEPRKILNADMRPRGLTRLLTAGERR
jgi:squalene-associated FAD-dependent desaturase